MDSVQVQVSGAATRRRVVVLLLTLLLILPMAACGGSSNSKGSKGATATVIAPTTSATAGAADVGSATPSAILATPTMAASPSTIVTTPPIAATPSGAASPSTATIDVIKGVIQRADREEAQAFAKNDPTLMRDTSTPSYYAQLVQELRELANSGIKAIQLVKLSWGPITLQGATTAQATTIETWKTEFVDGSTAVEAPDTNVYSLVLEGGTWKVQSDEHPDAQRLRGPSGAASGTPGAVPTPSVTAVPLGPGQSLNWAGYEATGGTFTAVAGSWTVPQIKPAGSAAANATWVGIGGVSSRDLIQAGTTAAVQGGQVAYSAWIETLPRPSQTVPLTVSAGDHISVSIAQQPSRVWQIVIRDTTTGKSYQASGTYGSSRSSAEWVEEAPTTGRRLLLPLDNFGTVRFKGATATEGGRRATVAQANGQRITLVNPKGQPLAQPSALGSDGSSFSVSRTSTAARPVVP